MTPPVASWVELQSHHDPRGSLAIAECGKQVPFTIQRVYYSYAVPPGISRAGHGHRTLEQVVLALNGSFSLTVSDGHRQEVFHLDDPTRGVYIPALRWRELANFSSDAVCLVLASGLYDANEYIKDYQAFLAECGQQ